MPQFSRRTSQRWVHVLSDFYSEDGGITVIPKRRLLPVNRQSVTSQKPQQFVSNVGRTSDRCALSGKLKCLAQFRKPLWKSVQYRNVRKLRN
jgi:hypothetical protein